MNRNPYIGSLVIWHSVILDSAFLGMITDVNYGYTINVDEGYLPTKVRVRWADDLLAHMEGSWFNLATLEILDE